jgi:spore maturation protein CgeB
METVSQIVLFILKAAYIGILTSGTTSRMRADWLRELTPGWDWQWVDTDEPMRRCHRLWRSLAFRGKIGPAVEAIQTQVQSGVANRKFDLIWVDKGVFLQRKTLLLLRKQTQRLVHFTPDTAFHANRSVHFNRGMEFYDLLVTTKSFEIEAYHRRVDAAKVFLTTQGYDPGIHFPQSAARRREVVFVGLAEPDREHCLSLLLEHEIPVRLAGRGWSRFLRRWGNCPHLHFEGEGVFGEAYAKMLAGSWVGLGLLSKKFPELHTTRTFEIPACGTILATERTVDTERFFDPNEVLLFRNYSELATTLGTLFASRSDEELCAFARAGYERVLRDGRDYASILRAVLEVVREKFPDPAGLGGCQ